MKPLDVLLEMLESSSRVHRLAVHVSGYLPPSLRVTILRSLNPSVTIGAVAWISSTDTSGHETILLGFHPYHQRAGTPWALLGGALKQRDIAGAHDSMRAVATAAVVREVKEETGMDVSADGIIGVATDWSTRTMDFYVKCSVLGTVDFSNLRLGPEIRSLRWFSLSELPSDMFPPHRRFVTTGLASLNDADRVPWS